MNKSITEKILVILDQPPLNFTVLYYLALSYTAPMLWVCEDPYFFLMSTDDIKNMGPYRPTT